MFRLEEAQNAGTQRTQRNCLTYFVVFFVRIPLCSSCPLQSHSILCPQTERGNLKLTLLPLFIYGERREVLVPMENIGTLVFKTIPL